jgi:uncharacterized damage-inducible protein DinB
MEFSIQNSADILERTPKVLSLMLNNISVEWTGANEGEGTWSVFDVVGHLIHGEKTDWIPRLNIILSSSDQKTFEAFDRYAQLREPEVKTLEQLLAEFEELRRSNIEYLRSKNISEKDLQKKGIHPAFGEVTLAQLLSTWVVHDLNHLGQIARVMAKQYKKEVGPWIEYLGILQR